MTEVIVKIIAELLSVLALATKKYKERQFSRCAVVYGFLVAQCFTEQTAQLKKKLLEDREMIDTLQKLDRLTQEEVPITVAQTLGAVHRLVDDVKRLMEGG